MNRRHFIKTGLLFVPTVFSAGPLWGGVRMGNLDPQVGNWLARLKARATNASGKSVVANDSFMKLVRAAGLRSKLPRVNTYTGVNLIACMTPLINDLGNAADDTTANNFDAGDYSEATGLTGDGSTEWISTGITMSSAASAAAGIGTNSSHLGVYVRTLDTNVHRYWIGSYDGTSQDLLGQTTPVGTVVSGSMHDLTQTITGSTTTTGHFVISRIASNDLRILKNGVSVASTAGSAGALTATFGIMVHTFNNGGIPDPVASDAALGGYHVGTGLTVAETASLYNAWQVHETILGRQV